MTSIEAILKRDRCIVSVALALVIVYAHRIGDQDGVGRAFDIYSSASTFHRQRLEAYRQSSEGGPESLSR